MKKPPGKSKFREGRPGAAPSPAPRASAARTAAGPIRRFAPLLALMLVMAVVAWWKFSPARRADSHRKTAGLDAMVMVDSLRACVAAREWESALEWAHACNVARPGTSGFLLNEALAWHNYAQGGSRRWAGRSAMRTSLDRMELEKRAIALLDSAEAVASTDEEWANIRRWRGAQFEVLRLPLDAMQAYDAALSRAPGLKPARDRMAWMQAMIVRPSNPRGVTAAESAPRP